MNSKGLRKEFLSFFEKKGHKIVPSSSIIPTDPSVLFTTAGMQQFKEYFLGKESPYGKNVVTLQKCFRTSDIETVGDESHLTFFEMLGNFSFGGYFKETAIKLAYDFLLKGLKLPLGGAVFTVFAGNEDIPEDKESAEIWKKLGVPENKIKKCSKEDNFWGPTGEEGPCGPTTEIHIQGTEIWNLVFNEYYQDRDRKLTLLKQKGVDTGMGLERLAMVVQKKPSIFEADLFEPIIREIPGSNVKAQRIIADHIKGAVFLISEGILPSNIERGSALRKIIRGALDAGRILHLSENFLIPLAQKVVEIYKDIYPELKSKETDILTVIQNEGEGYRKSETERERIAQKLIIKRQEGGSITGAVVYDIFSTTRIGMDRIKELAEEQEIKLIDPERFLSREREFKGISRAGAEKKFGGGGEFSPKLHTATHLLHAALRKVLGAHVKQMGSDIAPERLRFDFSHPQKITDREIKEVENLVNEKIREDLEVKKTEMKYEDAIAAGALAFFKEKYPEKVTVFSIGDFSKEICAGPHVKRTSELGHFKIIKEESSGAGIRRIRAILQ